MNREEIIKNFQQFFEENQGLVRERTVRIEDLPSDDEWVLDDTWDQAYYQEVTEKKNG